MLRTILLTALAAAIAIFGGAGSVWYALDAEHGIGALTIGAWTAYPDLGSPADLRFAGSAPMSWRAICRQPGSGRSMPPTPR
jgi:hypothetical protein